MDYSLNMGVFGNIFAVPNAVVDNYIKLANESSVKVLLYMLRYNGQNHTKKSIANALNITENAVEEAFVFWENANILSKDNILGVADEKAQNTSVLNDSKTQIVKKVAKSERKDYNISPSEIASRIEQSGDIKCLFMMSEQTFGKPLSHTEQRSLIWMHDFLGMSTEVILMLVTFCVSNDKANVKYIEKVAIDWHEREVNTLELAENEIKKIEEAQQFNSKIIKAFGINYKLPAKEQAFIKDWKEKGYGIELVEYAYEKTVTAIGKLNFPYINKILENWYAQGLTTKEQIDESQKTRFENQTVQKKEYSFDLNDYKSLVNNFGDDNNDR